MVNLPIYFDNAATTALDPSVLEVMLPYFSQMQGNPSSIHSFGREARSIVENQRKKLAAIVGTSPSEIFFTSGGTESDNTILWGSITSGLCKCIITSPIEHHAVLHTVEYLNKTLGTPIFYVHILPNGDVDMHHLEQLLQTHPLALVSLMHANNEVGNMINLHEVGNLCHKYNAVFHSDTVQTMGYYPFDLKQTPVDFVVGSAHKFYGPKGIGFMYIHHNSKINSFMQGGMQERNMRGGTENIAGIVGLVAALEKCYLELEQTSKHVTMLKSHLIKKLKENISTIEFGGESANLSKSHYKTVSVRLPSTDIDEMLLFKLDIKKIAVSGGSACSSGANIGSHVLQAMYGADDTKPTVRFSFSKYNTVEEVDYAVEVLSEVYR